MDEAIFKQKVLDAHARYNAQYKDSNGHGSFNDMSKAYSSLLSLNLDSDLGSDSASESDPSFDYNIAVEEPCTDLETLLAHHASFGISGPTSDAGEPVHTPIWGPSKKTKWARTHDVQHAVTLGLFTPTLHTKVQRVGKGEFHWVQPEDSDISEDKMEEDELYDEDMVVSSVVGATSRLRWHGQMEVVVKDVPSPVSAGSDRVGSTRESTGMVDTGTATTREDLDQEMMDVDDEEVYQPTLAYPKVDEIPFAASRYESSFAASTTPIVSISKPAALLCPPKLIDISDA
jgi:hypothetical protein